MSFKNLNFFLTPSIVQITFGFLFITPISTFYLNPSDFGVHALIIAITSLIGPLSSSGFSWIFDSNYFKISQQSKKELLFNILVIDFILKLFWVLIFWLISIFLRYNYFIDLDGTYFFYFNLAILTILSGFSWPIVSHILVLNQQANYHFYLEIARWLLSFFLVILCLWWFNLGLYSLFISPLIVNLILFSFEIFYIYKNITIKIRKHWFIEYFKVGIYSIPKNTFEILHQTIDRYSISYFMNSYNLGIYSHSQTYSNVFKVLNKSLNKVISPALLKSFTVINIDNKGGIFKIIRIVFLTLILIGIFISMMSYDLLNIITHGKFIKAAELIPLWFLNILIDLMGYPFLQFLIAKKKNKLLMKSSIAVSVVFLLMTPIAVYFFNLFGAALSIIASKLVITTWYIFYCLFYLNAPLKLDKIFPLGIVFFCSFIYFNSLFLSDFISQSLFLIFPLILIIYFAIKSKKALQF